MGYYDDGGEERGGGCVCAALRDTRRVTHSLPGSYSNTPHSSWRAPIPHRAYQHWTSCTQKNTTLLKTRYKFWEVKDSMGAWESTSLRYSENRKRYIWTTSYIYKDLKEGQSAMHILRNTKNKQTNMQTSEYAGKHTLNTACGAGYGPSPTQQAAWNIQWIFQHVLFPLSHV